MVSGVSEFSFSPFGWYIKSRVQKQYLLSRISDDVVAGVAVLVSLSLF